MFLPATALLASGLAVWLLILSWRVIGQRRTVGTSLGDGGHQGLERTIRAQANLSEYAPLFVILVGLAETMGGNIFIVSISAMVFVIGRVMHGYALAFSSGSPLGRSGGMVLTLFAYSIIIVQVLLIVLVG